MGNPYIMSPTPEELELGAKAYKQVRFYENVTLKDISKIPWIFSGCAGLVFLGCILQGHPKWWPSGFLLCVWIPLCAILKAWQNQAAKAQYATHKLLLHLLEEKYGDTLPWVVEEKQLSAARELEAEIAQSRPPASHA
jgi:hypothetical protein